MKNYKIFNTPDGNQVLIRTDMREGQAMIIREAMIEEEPGKGYIAETKTPAPCLMIAQAIISSMDEHTALAWYKMAVEGRQMEHLADEANEILNQNPET